MAIGIDVYVTVIGLFVWSFATIAWAIWKNGREEDHAGETTNLAEDNV